MPFWRTDLLKFKRYYSNIIVSKHYLLKQIVFVICSFTKLKKHRNGNH
jgi:hypothetical protein